MLRIGIAQINTTVGDISGNCRKIKEYIKQAEEFKVDIIAFPELSITGYPPEDLLLKPKFVLDNLALLNELSKEVFDIVAIVGFVDRKGNNLYNAASIIYQRRIRGIYHKMCLLNYGVFDEKRYFKEGEKPRIFRFKNIIFSVNICEDIWDKALVKNVALMDVRLIFNCSASPYHYGKRKEEEKILSYQAKKNSIFIAYANLMGGQDELVFDGASMVLDDKGRIIERAGQFKEDLLITDLDIGKREEKKPPIPKRKIEPLEPIPEIYQALILGLSDYVFKNGFKKVVIGLSGGIDSSLVAALATDALGKDNVIGVFMPSIYSSKESFEDAKELAENLEIKLINIPISDIFNLYLSLLKPYFKGHKRNITEENLQARIRGNILMALSNKFGWLVLATGNKSEISTGYATLYGDMAGGFACLKDIPKTLVYKLAGYRNSKELVIPERVLKKEPTAELKPDQKDSDTLPEYETLDPIVKAYIEEDKDLQEITSLGFDKKIVSYVLSLIDKSEYKRRQSPPGIKITPKAFGKDRRMPITNKYRG
ncbi:MAG: NAD+ synthase [bacterium]